MSVSLRILYVGPLWFGGTCRQRYEALQEMGHHVCGIDADPLGSRVASPTLASRIRWRLYRNGLWCARPADVVELNAVIHRQMADPAGWDVLWLDKALAVEPETLAAVRARAPRCRIVGYSPDDMTGPHNQSRAFRNHLRMYDVYFTTKSYGVNELAGLGCRRVEFVGNAYDPATHRPVPVSDEDRAALGGPVGFIGEWERERACSVRRLADAGIPVRVWGPSWRRLRGASPLLRVEERYLAGDEYARAVCAFDINLGFLRKINRDRQTQRSVEIPACGGFMLAERTDEHLALFAEGEEAKFFGSDDELIANARYYLAHPAERIRIGQNGRARCLRSGYSNHDRLRHMLAVVEALP